MVIMLYLGWNWGNWVGLLIYRIMGMGLGGYGYG